MATTPDVWLTVVDDNPGPDEISQAEAQALGAGDYLLEANSGARELLVFKPRKLREAIAEDTQLQPRQVARLMILTAPPATP